MLINISTGKPWNGEPIHSAELEDDISYPLNIDTYLSKEDLATLGLAPCSPFIVPAGQAINGDPTYTDNGDGTWQEVYPTLTPEQPPITEVSAAQALTALYEAGIYNDVANACLNHPRVEVQIWFSRSTVWMKSDPYLQAMQLEMGYTDDYVNQLFIAASKK